MKLRAYLIDSIYEINCIIDLTNILKLYPLYKKIKNDMEDLESLARILKEKYSGLEANIKKNILLGTQSVSIKFNPIFLEEKIDEVFAYKEFQNIVTNDYYYKDTMIMSINTKYKENNYMIGLIVGFLGSTKRHILEKIRTGSFLTDVLVDVNNRVHSALKSELILKDKSIEMHLIFTVKELKI